MDKIRNQFNLRELSGAFGDFGLFIPLVVAMTISAELNIGVILMAAGLMNIFTGWFFKQPIPVQPMKALAVIVISENMLKDELFAAGIMIGLILIFGSVLMNKIDKWIPRAIVRGIQLGVGVKLIFKALSWLSQLSFGGWDGIGSAIVIFILLVLMVIFAVPALLYIFLTGFVFMYLIDPGIYQNIHFSFPSFYWYVPEMWAFKHGFLKGVLPQLPLTILNSVIAVCALSSGYFPGRGITPKKMALSVGLMNLIAIPFGAVPMCHGASGLAAQYRFGARTGGSVIMLGIIKVFVGLLFGNFLFTIFQSYPVSILAPMLIFAGYELARQSQDAFAARPTALMASITALGIVLCNTFIGFLFGCGIYSFIILYRKVRL